MREMKDSGIEWIGEIPKDWEIAKVKNVFYRYKDKAKQETPVILSLARAGVKIRDMSKNNGQIAESYFDYNPVKVGDFLLNPMDLYSGANCNVSYVNGVISPAYVNLRAYNNCFAKYYDYYMKTQYWAMALFAHGKGVSFDNRWTLNNETLMNYFVPYPHFQYQQRIADYLDKKCSEIDSIIEKTKATIDEYKKLKQSVITEAVTKGLNPNVEIKDSGVKWVDEIPKHWEMTNLKNLTIKIGSGKTPLGGADVYVDEGVLFIRSQNVYDSGLNLDKATYITNDTHLAMKGTSVLCNDLLLNITGGSIGRCCIYDFKEEANVNQHVCIIRLKHNMIKKYVHYALISLIGYNEVSIRQTGGNREGLTFEAIGLFRIPLMPTCEQENITKYLDKKCQEIDSLIEKKQIIVSELESYKKSLIYECVTGKREV